MSAIRKKGQKVTESSTYNLENNKIVKNHCEQLL